MTFGSLILVWLIGLAVGFIITLLICALIHPFNR